jgi:RNA polymerase sigma-70 factor (ECF subfamily)
MSADTHGDEDTLALRFQRHRDRLDRMVRLRMDRRLQGRINPADVVQDAYLAARGKFPPDRAAPPLPFFLSLRLEVVPKLVDVHRFHLGTNRRR